MLKANRQYIEALTSGLAEGSDIKFKEGDRWCVDISKKTLHYNQRELNNWPIETVKGLILHETGHLKYTTIDEEQSDIYKAHPEAMQLIHNVLNQNETTIQQIFVLYIKHLNLCLTFYILILCQSL